MLVPACRIICNVHEEKHVYLELFYDALDSVLCMWQIPTDQACFETSKNVQLMSFQAETHLVFPKTASVEQLRRIRESIAVEREQRLQLGQASEAAPPPISSQSQASLTDGVPAPSVTPLAVQPATHAVPVVMLFTYFYNNQFLLVNLKACDSHFCGSHNVHSQGKVKKFLGGMGTKLLESYCRVSQVVS